MPSRTKNVAAIERFPRPSPLVAHSLLAAAAVAGLATRAGGDVILEPQIVQRAEGPDAARQSTEWVFVRDSAVAQEKFALAQKMERLKEWNKSADLFQEVLEKYPDRVIPDGTDAKGVINRYTSVTKGVLGRLCKWPQEGLDVYRGRYEPKAAEMVETAGGTDLFLLNKVYTLYFVTDAGKSAGVRLMDAHLENAEFAAAAWRGEQLLDLHPNLAAERPAVLFRAALAFHLAGQADKAQQRAGELDKQFPREMGMVRGRDVALTTVLKQELAQTPAAVAGAGSDSWPSFMGGPSRGAVSAARASAGTPLFKVPLAKPEFKDFTPQQRQQLTENLKQAAKAGSTLGIMPVADRGELYFQDGSRVYAVSLESGMPLPGWSQTHLATNGQFVLDRAGAAGRTQQQTLTLSDRAVLAVMGQQDRAAAMAGMTQTDARLVCLDRATGRENWVTTLATAADVPKNDDEKAVRGLQLSGSPLVVGDNVLCIGRGNRAAGQGDDCYVVAFDLNSGRYRWGCYVASSGISPNAMMGVAMPTGENVSHLAYADGRVYVVTNLGAVAALDAYSGTIVWLNLYPIDRPDFAAMNPNGMMFGRGFNGNMSSMSSASRLKPWQFNSAVVRDGHLFILPSDGKHLMVYEAGTGREVKKISVDQLGRWGLNQNANEQPHPPNMIVGVSGDRLIVAGDHRVLCVDWRKYDEAKFPGPNSEMVFWPSTFRQAIKGRPFMTADAVFVCADDRLSKLAIMKDGYAVESYPPFPRQGWDEGESPGNVLVTNDNVVIAGSGSVDVYTDLAVARAKLDAELLASPAEPEPRLRYAEVMFVAGQPDAALQRLDEAIALLGGMEAMRAGPGRDRVFTDALTFAQKSPAADRVGKRDRLVKLFDRAAAAASSPQQHVSYRMSRARFAEESKDFATAVKLYQEVLGDEAWRSVTLATDERWGERTGEQSGNPAQAEEAAERAIAEAVKAGGAALYAPFQEAAAKALAEAMAERDPPAQAKGLQEVAAAFPNSSVAAGARLAAADAYERGGQPRAAVRVLRHTWFKDPSGPNRPLVLEGIARNYLAVPDRNRGDMISTAAARLAQGASLAGDPKLSKDLKLPDGTVVAAAGTPFSAALDSVRRLSVKESDKTLPDFDLPKLPSAEERVGKPLPLAFRGPFTKKGYLQVAQPGAAIALPDATALVLPARDFARADRVVTWSPGGLSIWDASANRQAAAAAPPAPLSRSGAFPPTERGPADAPRGVAWVNDAALVWGGSKLFSIDAGTGKTLWQIDLSRLQQMEIVRATGDAGPSAPQVAMDPNQFPLQLQGMAPGGNVRLNGRIARGRNVVMNNVAAPPPAQAEQPAGLFGHPAPPPAGAGEQVAEVRPVGDRVLITTSTGRLMSAEGATGRIAWQARLAARTPDRLVASEDFAVVRVSDEGTARLFALDTYSGRIIGSRTFAGSSNAGPVNMALSAEGTLVYTLPDRLLLKDLYKGWGEEERVSVGQPGQMLYVGANQPGQLLIAEGRILALADNGNEKYVRVHSLETGQPLQLRYTSGDGRKQEVDRILTSGTKEWNVTLRSVGSYVYVVGPTKVLGYNLDRPAETWKSPERLSTTTLPDERFRDAFVGQRHLVLLDQPQPTVPAVPPAVAPGNPPAAVVPEPAAAPQGYRLHAFSRSLKEAKPGDKNVVPGESGRLDYTVLITDPAGIAPRWQAADGGFYYATGDGKVRVLVGSAGAGAPATQPR